MRGGLDGQAESVQIILRLNVGNANSMENDIVLGTRVKRVKMIITNKQEYLHVRYHVGK